MQRTLCAVLSLFALVAAARADEIRLKDGSKIIGSVVGYEDGSFKVETAYGFAMIRKDSVSEIVTAEPKQPSPSKSNSGKPAEDATPATAKPSASAPAISSTAISGEGRPLTPPKPLVVSESRSQPTPLKSAAYVGAKLPPTAAPQASQTSRLAAPQSGAASAASAPSAPVHSAALTRNSAPTSPAAPATPLSSPSAIPARPNVEAVAAAPASVTISSAASTAPTAAAAPLPTPAIPPVALAAALPAAVAAPPAEPLPVREMVRGNLYINQTYGFEMYRAPDWQPIVAARAALPNAIAALGTNDQSTMLIIGRERAHETLDAQSAATEKMVQEVYENYRPMPPVRMTIGGSPAISRHFRGAADNRDWSVVLVTLERGDDVFTILAMTDANSELDQIQENVISKAVASLQFTGPANSQAAPPSGPHAVAPSESHAEPSSEPRG